MYRHILVPLHSADRAFDTVGRALALARPLDARVTFFHVVVEEDAHEDAPLLQTLAAPELRDSQRTGRARELLSKAEAGARALGVPCDARWTRGRSAETATLQAAGTLGCDVLFVAPEAAECSAGGIGALSLSELAGAGLPVLVAPVMPPAAGQRALAVIRDEHRALGAVIHACMSLLAASREAGTPVDLLALGAALSALRSPPLGLHHAKEEQHLFGRLRARSQDFDTELDELQRQHVRDQALLDELAMRLHLLEDAAGLPARLAASRALEDAMGRFAELHWEHMGREEAVVIPAARALLTPEDWAALNAVFAHAPSGNAELDFRQLLARLSP